MNDTDRTPADDRAGPAATGRAEGPSPTDTLGGAAARALRAARGARNVSPADTPAADTPGADTPAFPDTAAPEAVEDDTAADTDIVAADTAEDTAPVADDPVAEHTAEIAAPAADDPVAENTAADTARVAEDPDAPPELVPAGRIRRPRLRSRRDPKCAEASPDPLRSRLLAAGALLTAAALVFVVVAGTLWWRAGHNDDRTEAQARDAVAVDARLAIATVNTSDYRKAANALTNWIAVATGPLKEQFTASQASAVTLLGQAKTITRATVLDLAVTALDVDKGTATVIASVNVRKQPASGAATTVRNRFRASLTRVDGEWKLADLGQVDVQLS